MEKPQNITTEVTFHLAVQFGPVRKIKMNLFMQNMWLYPTKEYVLAAPKLRAKH